MRATGAQALPQCDSVTLTQRQCDPPAQTAARCLMGGGRAQHGHRDGAMAPVPGGTKLDGRTFLLDSPLPYFRNVANQGNTLRSENHARWAASCPHAGMGLGHSTYMGNNACVLRNPSVVT